MTAPKGRLFQLALDCKKYVKKGELKNKTDRVSGKHYDEGNAISLSYNIDVYGQSIYDAYRHNEPSAQLSFVDDMQGEAFYVEPFESETIPASYEEVNDKNPMLDKVVRLSEEEEEVQEVGAGSEEETRAVTEKKPAPDIAAEKPGEPAKPKGEKPENKYQETENEDNEPYQVDDDEFANDIKAILQGQKVFDPEKKQTVNKSESPSKELLKQGGSRQPQDPGKPPKKEESLEPSANEHKIFEKIAQSMRYANSYDLGSIAMEKKFDQMENEIEDEEIKTITSKKPVEEANVIGEEQKSTAVPKNISPDYSPEQALTPENGGLKIEQRHLKRGDLILITSEASETEKICNAGIYLGDSKIVMADEANKIQKVNLDQALNEVSVVVLRHRDAGADDIQTLTDKFNSGSDVQGAQEPVLEVNYTPVQIHKSVCESVPKEKQDKCRQFKGKININTDGNDKFFIPYALIKGLEASGLNILDKSIEGSSADVPVKTNHNGQWQYAGHLVKN
ncbi:hypothetical protein LVD17_23495 [Fulvivirga ulvae]|uniref:hypothetical protein n=1 Tax=Fulvivirga ulvae TaxID=2904245 RepID=UPI001F1A441F|nr:hypothetical protein [Fulvivirga ulvae]UII31260.1 hypothetical protein LVD17_23495 [Fulvivirga ulvae]